MTSRLGNTVLGLIILCGAIAAVASQQTETQPAGAKAGAAADLENGKAVYTKSCQKCHAVDGKGNPAIAKMQKVTFRPLGAPEVLTKSDAELIKGSTQGT